MDVEAFSRYAEVHEEVDRGLDEEMLRWAAPGRVLDGRVSGALARRRGIACHYLVVTCTASERYRRLAGRDGVSVAEAESRTLAREASERDRYLRYYAIDLDQEVPDLTVDSTTLDPPSVVARLVSYLRPSGAPGRP